MKRLSIGEIFGITPLPERARQALYALVGDELVPGSRYDLSSLKLLRPSIAFPLWRGRYAVERQVVITNLFNHTPTPIEEGWSVRRTQIRDFRDRSSTYDSHNGTDFCIPVGTIYRAPASGVVARVVSEFHRGGLKVAIDHGHNLISSGAHLARSLVREGDRVKRGQPVAITGYSGLDSVVTFPWGVPHVHFNVWFNGVPVDPFARSWADEASLWVDRVPVPLPRAFESEEPVASEFDPAKTAAAIARCRDAAARARLESVEPLERRGSQLVFEMAYYPTRFERIESPYLHDEARTPRMHLPFSADDFDGCVFADDL